MAYPAVVYFFKIGLISLIIATGIFVTKKVSKEPSIKKTEKSVEHSRIKIEKKKDKKHFLEIFDFITERTKDLEVDTEKDDDNK